MVRLHKLPKEVIYAAFLYLFGRVSVGVFLVVGGGRLYMEAV